MSNDLLARLISLSDFPLPHFHPLKLEQRRGEKTLVGKKQKSPNYRFTPTTQKTADRLV
jgi:hypothetical protein